METPLEQKAVLSTDRRQDRFPFVLANFPCAPGKIRTFNLLIRSQVLYPLSYGRRSRSIVQKSSVRSHRP